MNKKFLIPLLAVLGIGVVLAVYTVIFSIHISGAIAEPITGQDITVSLNPVYTGDSQTGNFTVTNKANVSESSVIDWMNTGNTDNLTVEVSLDNVNFVDLASLGSSGFVETWQPGTNTVYYKITYTGNNVGDVIAGDIQVNSELKGYTSPIVDVTYKYANAMDSGNYGYWALDNYTENLKIYPTSNPNVYQVNVTDMNGTFCTFAGLPSPENGTPELDNGCGTIIGGYNGYLTTSQPLNATIQSLGEIDLGGTQAKLLAQNTTGVSSAYTTWINAYFPGTISPGGSWSSVFSEPNWGWSYYLQNQNWVDSSNGITGNMFI